MSVRSVFIAGFSLILACSAAVQATPILWSSQSGLASGPPYPTTESTVLGVYEQGLLLPAVQRSALHVTIQDVLCDGSVRPQANLPGSSNGASGAPGDKGFLDLVAFYGIQNVGTAELGFASLNPATGGSQPATLRSFNFGSSFFDVFFDVAMGDGSVFQERLHGELPAVQSFAIQGLRAAVMGDGSVRVAFDVKNISPAFRAIPAGNTLVNMTLTGEVVPEPATVAFLLTGAVGLLRRRAR